MKKLKKVFAVLLTLVMVLGMSMTSFAAPATTATLKVTGLTTGENVTVTVRVVPILKLNDAGNQWEFASDAASKLGMSLDELISKSAKGDATNGKINTDLAKLDLTSEALWTGDNVWSNTTTTGEITYTGAPGLYAIEAVDSSNEYIYSYMVGAIDYDNGVLQNATVKAKGQSNQPEKEIVGPDDASPAAGDDVEFKITVHYPTFAQNAVTKKMDITDTVSNGTIVSNSVVIPEGYGLTVLDSSTSTELKIGLTGTYDPTKAGDEIVITYTVKVNETLDEGAELVNKVVTTIPDKDGTDVSRQAIVELPTFTANIMKANGDTTDKLAITTDTATFALYKAVTANTEGAEEYTINGEPKYLKLVESKDTVQTTGIASFTGLSSDDEYYVMETKAPEGFQLDSNIYPLTGNISLGNPTKVTGTEKDSVTGKDIKTVTTSYPNASGTYTTVNSEWGSYEANNKVAGAKFFDSTLAELPSTGGIGTTIFTIGGCVIMIAAAALFFASRRKSAK